MKLIEAFTKLSTDLSESNAHSNLMEDFPPICKKDPLEVQMNYIKDHFATTGKVIRLEDVPENMYGSALPIARSRKSKRKAITKDEYLDDAPKAKKEKKEKAPVKVNVVGPAVPTIQEEVQDLNADVVLNKRTRSGKVAASSQTAHEQPLIPKKKRKTTIRKLKESTYVAENEEQIAAATDLVTREVKRKKAEDDAALQKALEIAKEIEVPASSLARADAITDAQEVVQATEEIQGLETSEAGNMLMIVSEKAAKKAQEDETTGSGAAAPEADKGNPDSSHTYDVIAVESDSTPFISSQSTSSSSSLDFDDIPIGQVYSTTHKGLSPSTKLHKKPTKSIPFEPMIPNVDEKIGDMSEMRNKVCERLPPNHPFQPPMIKPLNFIHVDAEVVGEQVGSDNVNVDESSSSHPTSTNQTLETSVLDNLVSHYSGELPGVESNSQRASKVAYMEVAVESP
jgi:hypothetical protein